MKYSVKTIIILAISAVLLITAYQAYWLTDIYVTLQKNYRRDVDEAMRSADFEEINSRVNILKQQSYGGTMAISVGSDNSHESVGVRNEYSAQQDESSDIQEDVGSTIPYDNFSDALRDEEAVRRVGLYLQKGIHDGLDELLPIRPECYDSLICFKLDSLRIKRKHSTLYLQKSESGYDTLRIFGEQALAQADTFRLYLNSLEDKEYVLLLEKKKLSVPQQMHSALLFSFFTLIILIIAFWYIINMIRRMKILDEMKTDFTNNITHELKTPIAVAYAANDALLNFGETISPEKGRKFLTISQEQLSLLSQLVEQILSLSMEKRNSMKFEKESVTIAPLIEKLIESHRLKATKQFTVDCDIPSDMSIHTDRIHLNNILNNLIDNAIKYSGKTLNLAISAKRVNDSDVMISIADNGIGISKEQQRYVFDKFYRVPHGNIHNIKGYGLGLYYVKTMMKKMGGDVTLESEEGKGTTFILTFHGNN